VDGIRSEIRAGKVYITLSKKQANLLARLLLIVSAEVKGGAGWAVMRTIARSVSLKTSATLDADGFEAPRRDPKKEQRSRRILGAQESGVGRVYTPDEILEYEVKS